MYYLTLSYFLNQADNPYTKIIVQTSFLYKKQTPYHYHRVNTLVYTGK